VSGYSYQYLSFKALETLDLFHLFLAKPVKPDRPAIRSHPNFMAEVLSNLGFPRRPVISLKQIHSSCAVTIKTGPDFDATHFQPEADAIFTNRRDVYLTVRVADCLPVYVFDSVNQVIGLIHAGWRGTLLEITKRSLQSAQKELGLNPQTSTVLFGPYIKSCCYEVSAEVSVLFKKSSTYNRGGKVFLDLGQENKQQFIEAGINSKKIHITDQCTCCNPDLFFSYRRSKNKYERMYAVLGLK
jgi:hypothetical protein